MANSIFDQDLERNPANYAPLSPLTFLERAGTVYPELPAIVHGFGRKTIRRNWRQTYARCRRLADVLTRRGLGRGDTVAVMLANTPEMVEVHFGVPMAGCVLNAINTRLDAGSVAFMLEHGEAKLFLVDREFAATAKAALAQLKRPIEVIDVLDPIYEGSGDRLGKLDYEEFIAGGSAQFVWSPPGDEWDAIALNYTSGTTGNPKGVLYSHRSTLLHTFAAAMPDALNISARDVLLPVVPMFHVNAWGLPYIAAMVGTKLVFPGPQLDGKSLYELFESERVTCSAGVPTVWQGLLGYTEANQLKFSTMHRTVIGGSACPPAMLRLFQDKYGVQVLHAWGMTEMSPLGTACTLKSQHRDMNADERAQIQFKQGRVIYGVDMKIVGDDGGDLPWDGHAFGDLHVRGPWVVRKYFKEEGEDPLRDGWFPTGDVATIDSDGYMQITDRSKDVIKSGGEWISSIEIENVAMSHPAVAMAACIAAPHPKWDERPLLVVVKRPNTEVTRAQMLSHYEGRVAKWQVPDDVVFVDAIPLGATGKMLKAKLREQFRDYRFPVP